MSEPRYIIWDERDGAPRRDDDGAIISDGLIGRVGPDNVYIKVYAGYDDDTPFDKNGRLLLEVGHYTGATFRLSGQKGYFQIWRVA